MFYEVIPIKLFRADSGILTYSSDLNLKPGHFVEIPLGSSTSRGVILKKVKAPGFKCKPISKLLHEKPLPPYLLKSLLWLSEYYLTPLPTVANLLLPPPPINKNTFINNKKINNISIPLNTAQNQALRALKSVPTATKLLHGVTGSGKTNIYLKLALDTFKAEKSTILLVPEIALTSQLVQIFERTFEDSVICLHSHQTNTVRRDLWYKIHESTNPLIIIGPRSALLSPVHNLGLIIIDEAHESSYSQENAPKYSALRLASFIANTLKITCLEGTATPLVADFYLAEKNHAYVPLKERAKKEAITPEIHLIDLKSRENFLKNRYFSDELLSAIKANLENHRQTLIFHNRRGSSPMTICTNCGWQALCPTCFLPLNLHSDSYSLICHACGFEMKVPICCPECKHPEIVHKGFGTKLLESELKKLFKDAQIARFDADNSKATSLDNLYDDVKSGKIDIIIGTQTVAKGLDLPHLATVGVVQADSGLSLPDFAAEERTFHLLTQVIGRVGRGHLDVAEVFLQTYQPDHPVITSAVKNDYDSFASHLLKRRKSGQLPPYSYLARLDLTYKTEPAVLKQIRTLYKTLLDFSKRSPKPSASRLIVARPTPAFHERSLKGYTWQIVLRSNSRKVLTDAIKSLPDNPHLHFTLDPPSLL